MDCTPEEEEFRAQFRAVVEAAGPGREGFKKIFMFCGLTEEEADAKYQLIQDNWNAMSALEQLRESGKIEDEDLPLDTWRDALRIAAVSSEEDLIRNNHLAPLDQADPGADLAGELWSSLKMEELYPAKVSKSQRQFNRLIERAMTEVMFPEG